MDTMVREEVCDVEKYEAGFPPADLEGCIAWFQDKLCSIPEDLRASARVHFSVPYFDEGLPSICVEYQRPETAAEEAARQKREELQRSAEVDWELETLKRLKAKYESDTEDGK